MRAAHEGVADAERAGLDEDRRELRSREPQRQAVDVVVAQAERHRLRGAMTLAGVELVGKADVVQRSAAGLAIADFKTGRLPSQDQVKEGFALQLGLLAVLAEAGALADVDAAAVAELAYWKLKGNASEGGEAKSTDGHFRAAWADVPAFIAMCRATFEAVKTMSDAPGQRLVITGLKVQAVHALQRAPIAAVSHFFFRI